MYNSIHGQITVIRGDYLVITNNGIGYKLRVPNPFDFDLGSEKTLHTHLVVREDSLDLYGFATSDERDFFLKLISVKGLGPKGALAIIGSDKIDKVMEAIDQSDSKYLQKFPGIGPKASQQIILDLHGKVNFKQQATSIHPKIKQSMDALSAMGYNANEIKKMTQDLENNTDQSIGDMIKIALKKLF